MLWAALITAGLLNYPHAEHSLEFILEHIHVFREPVGADAYFTPEGGLMRSMQPDRAETC